ncbi:MAG: ubiquinone/menaquinone biosynthesis methyltransferase, partial [Bacteroidales bacterium]|nr:ubiquinone/menaquinone biosynthesis methyltransferase [Bacteroidales bacterium]
MQVRSARNHWRIEMFDTIAPTYDILNHLLSAGIDKSWRKKGIQAIRAKRPKKILDIATGTGDLAILANKILQPEEIIGIDISEKMLQIAIQKAQAEGAANIQFLHGDCMNLHFPENAFDAVTVAFGVRNFEKLEQGLQEILRVLKPDGQLMI